jgi:hypothetical protein
MSLHLKTALRIGLATAAAALLAGSASAGGPNHAWGTSAAPGMKASAVKAPPPGLFRWFRTWANADYTTGGIALRNIGTGSIHVNGLASGARDAWLYWSVLFSGSANPTQTMTVKRLWPGGAPTTMTVTGTLIATGADPCWSSSGNAVYRAQVPTTIVKGNGVYQVTMQKGASARTDGGDPWDGDIVYPLAEGASLVVVANGTHTVALYDGYAGTEAYSNGGAFVYSLKLPSATTDEAVLMDVIGADGQLGLSRYADPNSGETTTVNSVPISGISGRDPNGDWDGGAGWPLPQLWDDTGHNITNAALAGTTRLDINVSAPGSDCLVWVANVVGY